MSRTQTIHETVIVDTYYGWDKVEVKSLGFFEKWFDACKAGDDYVNRPDVWHYPPYKWEVKQHSLKLSKDSDVSRLDNTK